MHPFHSVIHNNNKLKNIYNMDKNELFISCNKRQCTVVRKTEMNQNLVQYNSRDLVLAIKAICMDNTS